MRVRLTSGLNARKKEEREAFKKWANEELKPYDLEIGVVAPGNQVTAYAIMYDGEAVMKFQSWKALDEAILNKDYEPVLALIEKLKKARRMHLECLEQFDKENCK